MDAEHADKVYAHLIRKGDAENVAIRDRSRRAFQKLSDDVGDAVHLFKTEIAPLIAGASQEERFKDASTLLNGIATESAAAHIQPGEYAGWLALWNGWFQQRQLKLNQPPILAGAAIAMLKEINNAGWDDDAGFKAYCATVPNPHRGIHDMRQALAGAGLPMTDVYTTMHFLQQHALPIARLNAGTAKDIHHLSLLAPPLTAFAGYADWGPGNHGSIAENKAKHFLKHVLDAHPEPKQALPWQGECAVWWEKLDIRLKRETAAQKMPGPLFDTVKSHFPAGPADALALDKVETVVGIVKAHGGWGSSMLDHFKSEYEAKYLNAAITMSQSMTNIIVHVDEGGTKVNLKGLNGRYFLGGRLEGTTLGLSTCFVPKPGVDLAALNVDRQVWQVSPL
jgi:hypothetical protein